jgi:hypothetical protein
LDSLGFGWINPTGIKGGVEETGTDIPGRCGTIPDSKQIGDACARRSQRPVEMRITHIQHTGIIAYY